MDTSKTQQQSSAGREQAATVWATMRQMYGEKWARSFGATPTPAWVAGVRDLSAAELRRGFRHLADSGGTFPPALPEFRSLCRPPAPKRTPEQAALYGRVEREQPPPSLERLASGSAEGRRWLAYWWRRGLRPRPAEVTDAMLDELCSEADAVMMDGAVKVGRHRILDRYGVAEGER